MGKGLKRRIIDMIVRILLLVAIMNGLSACQTTKGSFCDIAEPRRPSEKTLAVMSDAEVKDDLAHNRKGQRLCGWKPQ
jgi:hypothetical protein